jgi:uncharacterized protein DUF3168
MGEPEMIAAIAPIVGGRLYPDIAPPGAAMPFATLQQIGGAAVNFLAGASDKVGVRMQINVWSKSRAEAMTLIRQIEVAMADQLHATVEGGAIARYDEQTGTRGAMQDFSLWFDA